MFLIRFCLCSVVVDIFVFVVYCFVIGMIIEIVIFGMIFQQLFFFWLVLIFVNILIVWFYGVYCDVFICFVCCYVGEYMWVRNFVDLLVYVSFQLLVYVLILWFVGVDLEQIIMVVVSNVLVLMVMGVVYGYFLEYCCKLFCVVGYI